MYHFTQSKKTLSTQYITSLSSSASNLILVKIEIEIKFASSDFTIA